MTHYLRVLALSLCVLCFGLVTAAQEQLSASPTHVPPHDVVVAEIPPQQAILASHLAAKYSQPLYMAQRIVQAAFDEGARFDLPPTLLLAMMEKESSLRHEVVNSYGAVGLMQVVPRWHPEKMLTDEPKVELAIPEINISVGAQILSEYLRSKNGNMSAALRKYSGNATRYAEKVYRYQLKLEKIQAMGSA